MSLLDEIKDGRKNLSGAKLRYADLTGANLTDANLTGASLTRTGVLRIRTSFEVTAYPDGRIAYGCVTLPIDEWRKHVHDLAREHAPDDAQAYVDEIMAIIALARVATTRRREVEVQL